MKKYIAGILTGILLMSSTFAYAETSKTINVVFDRVKLIVNGKTTDTSTMLYDGNAYIQLKDAATAFNAELKLDATTNTASLTSKTDSATPAPKATPAQTGKTDTASTKKFVVYWGSTGKKVHIDPQCRTIKNGALSGTLDECKNAGHTDGWCGVCSSGWSDEKFLSNGNPYAK